MLRQCLSLPNTLAIQHSAPRHGDQWRCRGEVSGAGRNLVVGLGLGNVDALCVPDGCRAVGKSALEGLERSLWRFRSARVGAALPLGVSALSVVTLREGAEEKKVAEISAGSLSSLGVIFCKRGQPPIMLGRLCAFFPRRKIGGGEPHLTFVGGEARVILGATTEREEALRPTRLLAGSLRAGDGMKASAPATAAAMSPSRRYIAAREIPQALFQYEFWFTVTCVRPLADFFCDSLIQAAKEFVGCTQDVVLEDRCRHPDGRGMRSPG